MELSLSNHLHVLGYEDLEPTVVLSPAGNLANPFNKEGLLDLVESHIGG